MHKLPVLLSIPHGGMKSPEELRGHLCLTDNDLFDDIDPCVVKIYDLGEKVEKVISTEIARTFVDLNRSLQDLPPENPDGLIKSMTCYQKPIYLKGKEPDENMTKKLIELYYTTYHRKIQQAISSLDLQLCLDCHSMAEFAPAISPDGQQKKRPLFCISNLDGKTSSKEMLELLGNCIAQSFSISKEDINFNSPFKGGHITKTYGNNPIPWIQIEMNRSMYLSEEWFKRETLSVDKDHLAFLNKSFEKCLQLFFKSI